MFLILLPAHLNCIFWPRNGEEATDIPRGEGNLTFSRLPSLISSYDLSFFPAAPMPHPQPHGLTLPGIGIFFLGGKFSGSGTHKQSNTIQWGPRIGGLMTYTCQLFLRYKREIFILGMLGFLKTTQSFPKIPEEVRSLPKKTEVF